MFPADPTQFVGLPAPDPPKADVRLLPLPVEKTVSYGAGTRGGPRAIIEASYQLEPFDEELLIDYSRGPLVHTLPPLTAEGDIRECLARIRDHVRPLRDKFLLSLGGEHTVTYGTVHGLFDDLSQVTVVQFDAHADMADELRGLRWSHGTVMRRLWEEGCGFVQIGIRSLTRSEHGLVTTDPRITTYYAHELTARWSELLDHLRRLEGQVYLTIDVDGLDPSIIPSTGTPMPDGLSWRQTMELLRALLCQSRCRLAGADIVEFVPSAAPPGCDPVAARLAAKLLGWWWAGKNDRRPALA